MTLQQIDRHGAYTDIALDRTLGKTPDLSKNDRALLTALLYSVVHRQHTLNAIIDHLGTKGDRPHPASPSPNEYSRVKEGYPPPAR